MSSTLFLGMSLLSATIGLIVVVQYQNARLKKILSELNELADVSRKQRLDKDKFAIYPKYK